VKNRDYRPVVILPLLFVSCFLLACNSQPSKQAQSGQCPQERSTEYAPASVSGLANPLLASMDNITDNIKAGEKLYQKAVKPVACIECHGEDGNGNGRMASMFEPAPRNFTCSEIVSGLPDGQLFWVIKNGSTGTSMPAFDKLTDEQIWQITMYLRSFDAKYEPVKHPQPESAQPDNRTPDTEQAAL